MKAGTFLALLLLACGLLVSSASRADYDWYNEQEGSRSEPEPRPEEEEDHYVAPYGVGPRSAGEGFGIGLRLAYAHPLGEIAKKGDLDDFTRGVIKGQLDLEYGLSPEFVVGLYLAVGGGFLPKSFKRNCDLGEATCKQLSIESGLSAAYRFLPHGLIDPWLGANLGLEWLRDTIDSSLANGSISFLGLAFGASVGVDVQLKGFAFGPYFSPQFGRFMRGKSKLDIPLLEEGSASGKIDDQAFHFWLNFGLRARYQF
jgi:hypothetical protein